MAINEGPFMRIRDVNVRYINIFPTASHTLSSPDFNIRPQETCDGEGKISFLEYRLMEPNGPSINATTLGAAGSEIGFAYNVSRDLFFLDGTPFPNRIAESQKLLGLNEYAITGSSAKFFLMFSTTGRTIDNEPEIDSAVVVATGPPLKLPTCVDSDVIAYKWDENEQQEVGHSLDVYPTMAQDIGAILFQPEFDIYYEVAGVVGKFDTDEVCLKLKVIDDPTT